MSNAERFLVAFSIIEKKLNQKNRSTEYRSFSQLLADSAKKSYLIRYYQENLREYSELRNAIVHFRDNQAKLIATPSDEVTNEIEHIANLLKKEEKAFAYASKPVKTIALECSVQDAYRMMRELETTKLPIYHQGKYYGLITLEDLAQVAFTNRNLQTGIQELVKYTNSSLFVSKDISAEDVINLFYQELIKGKTHTIILITEDGNQTQKPIGIITNQDLPKLLKLMFSA